MMKNNVITDKGKLPLTGCQTINSNCHVDNIITSLSMTYM